MGRTYRRNSDHSSKLGRKFRDSKKYKDLLKSFKKGKQKRLPTELEVTSPPPELVEEFN
jgi:hypothetical protein